MNGDEYYRLVFKELLNKSEDGFIVINTEGTITDINDVYCEFLNTTKEEAIGSKIESIIPTTSMYNVLKKQIRGDYIRGKNQVYFQPYRIPRPDGKSEDDYAIGNRFCIYDENGILIGAAAHMKFRQRALIVADQIMQEELRYYKENYQNSTIQTGSFEKILTKNHDFIKLKLRAMKVSNSDFPVLITGETGTGKEMFAKAIHVESDRKTKPLICINCAAIPEELLESEFFGYEEGAFTGAKKGGKIGKFELANNGTIFLDEIGDMSLNLQAKLLRVLQEQEIERVGGTKTIPINVRVVSATRQNLEKMIETGKFREDLYYRLNVIRFNLPPLRNRQEDIPLYIDYFLNVLNQKYKKHVKLSPQIRFFLQNYSWPGNVRELENVLTSAFASCVGEVITASDLPAKITGRTLIESTRQSEVCSLTEIMDECERETILNALEKNSQNVMKTARELNVERSLLYKKMKRLGIVVNRIKKK